MIHSIVVEVKCDAPGCDARLALGGWDIECVDEATVNELAVENKWRYDGDGHHFCSMECQTDHEKEIEYCD